MSSPNQQDPNGSQSPSQQSNVNDMNLSRSENINNETNGVRNIRTAADALRDQLPLGNIILEEANMGGDLNPDVLFRGGFSQGFPNFSVTIDRTNITQDGTVAGEPIFNFGNLPDHLRELVESAIRSGRPRKKQATEDAIKRLKIIDPLSLKESERTCSICYDAFEEPKDDDNDGSEAISNDLRATFLASRELLDNDPPILLPKDTSGNKYGEYHRMKRDPSQNESNKKKDEHIPVEMPCGHIFGRSCLLEWLKSNISCPLCRREVEAQPAQSAEGYEVDRVVLNNRTECPANWSENGNLYDDPQIPFPSAARNHVSIFSGSL